MYNIQSIHQNILDYLLELRKEDKSLYFIPRQNNKNERLDQGYWFLGNDNYCVSTFWEGRDWKSRIPNIGFFVVTTGESHLELSSKPDDVKAIFLAKVADAIGGFEKSPTSNVWKKRLKGKNYIENLKNFLKGDKLLIDRLISEHKPKDLNLLDESKFEHYTRRVQSMRSTERKKRLETLDEGNFQNTAPRKRVVQNAETEVTLRHAEIQNKLKLYLDATSKYKKVQIEKDNVDIKTVDENDEWEFYEIKTDNALKSIRNGLGQILEYKHKAVDLKVSKLIIIAEAVPDDFTISYLDYLRKEYNLPLVYQVFDVENMSLSVEY